MKLLMCRGEVEREEAIANKLSMQSSRVVVCLLSM